MHMKLILLTLISTFLLLSFFIATRQANYKNDDNKYVTYINRVLQYWPSAAMAGNLGVPGYSKNDKYNVYILTFWLSTGVSDTCLVFQDALTYFSVENPWNQVTNPGIQQAIVNDYHSVGAKLLGSAFGATEFPASAQSDPVQTCNHIADWVLANNLDGIDLDFEDNDAMEAGIGEAWIIQCTKTIRAKLPVGQYILTHAPQAPYFTSSGYYKNGGYIRVNNEVGDLIDWYNVQFYNQGPYTKYESYDVLYVKSGGDWPNTSVLEMIDNGVDPKKIVIGKPVTQGDAMNTGWVSPSNFGSWAKRFQTEEKIKTGGMMTWQYSSDLYGNYINAYLAAFTN